MKQICLAILFHTLIYNVQLPLTPKDFLLSEQNSLENDQLRIL